MSLNPIIDSNGNKYWYQNDKLHRLDGPAIEFANGDKEWWQNDKLHRLDGPAIEWANGHKCWYIDNIRYNNYLEYIQTVINYKKGKSKCLKKL